MSLTRLPITIVAAALLALGVAACGSGDTKTVTVEAPAAAGGTDTNASGGSGKTVKIIVSVPPTDHGWLGALSKNAKAAAAKFDDVDFELLQAADADSQAQQIEQAIAKKPDVLVVLPQDGAALTPVAQKAEKAGIPVINIDRLFTEPDAATATILGDNYQIGVLAAGYIADELSCKGNVVEIQGLAGISVTEDRTKGFEDTLKKKCPDGGIKIVAQQPGDFNPDTGLKVMENILTANKQIDAVYTHDDDMAQGVVQAIRNAGREDEMFLTGVGGSKDAMDQIEAGGLYRATFLYNPNMAASAVNMARLIGLGEGFPELVPPEVPRQIIVPAAVVTKDNVADYKQYAFNWGNEPVSPGASRPGRLRAAGEDMGTGRTAATTALLIATLGAAGAHAANKRVLIVTATEGKQPAPLATTAERRLVAAARSEGLTPVRIRNASGLTIKRIRGAAAIVFAAGEGTILPRRRQEVALNRRIRHGGGVVLIGNAAWLQPRSRDFVTLVGAAPEAVDTAQTAEVQFVDKLHPATVRVPRRWHVAAPWVTLKKNPAGRVHVLGWVDEKTYKPGEKLAMGVEHPVSWCRQLGRGRAFTTTLGLDAAMWKTKVFRRHIAGAIAYAAGTRSGGCWATVWSSWKRTVIDEDITDGTMIEVGPDGRVYYLERTASQLKIYDPVADTVKDAGAIPSVPGLGQGLMGLAIDPNFNENRWIYIYRHIEGLTAHLSRFVLGKNDQIDLTSEKVLLRIENTGADHNGGGVAMRSNGDLFLAIGANDMPHFDGFYGSRNPTPIIGTGTQTDAEATTQNTMSLLGKVLRIHPEPDGTYTIPEGNMFPPGTPNTLPEILTMGHRNAFHIKVDDLTGEVLEGDVGPDAREDDPQRGPQGYDEFNLITGPANYGWPYCVGPNLPYNDIDAVTHQGSGEPFDCNKLVNRSPNSTGLKELGPASVPFIWYPYGVGKDFPEMSEAWAGGTDGGRVAIPGPRYRSTPESKLPLFFDGSWFVADWTRNWIKQVILDDQGKVLRIQRVVPKRGLQGPIDLDVGQDGSIYVLEWGGQGIPFGNPTAAKVVRFQYVPGCGTCDPTVPAGSTATPAPGTAGNIVAGPLAQTAGFLTPNVTLAEGASLTFVNLDAVAHNVASVALGEDGQRLFASSNAPAGSVVVEGADKLKPGKYPFLCTVHPSMTGTLEVQ
jgi:ABC-type sugar transport system substrate-binding protein/glucose/arabinose dehydrogenase/plastocyanin